MSEFETLSIERRGPVAEVTLTRPDLYNRFDDALHVELARALTPMQSDSDLRAIVWAAQGKVFSAGGAFDLMLAAHSGMIERMRIIDDGRRLLAAVLDLPQPVVVALTGDALGVGATVALACDAIVSTPGVRIGDPHVNIGLVAGDGGCLVWPLSAGMLRARRHLLTGDPLDAERAYELGLVTDLVEDRDAVLPAARALAERIAALPPLAVQGTKRALNAVMRQRAAEVVDLSFAHETITLASDDLVEAINAFKEQRPGRYQGR